MYKKLYPVIIFFLCVIFLSFTYSSLTFASSTGAESSAINDNNISIGFGYDGTVRLGRYVPINIEYDEGKDFEGKVLIKTATLSGENYRYEYGQDRKR